MAADLLRVLEMPSFSTLIARSTFSTPTTGDDFSAALPHERRLAFQFGLASNVPTSCSPQLAIAAMHALGLRPSAGTWFVLNPVHIHVARDHLILTDQRQLMVQETDARALFNTAQPYFHEVGKELIYGDAQTWFVQANDWAQFDTATPDAACGHNIDIWMAKGDLALHWRKLQNEVQMRWHVHPVNEMREAHGLKTINSLWLWGAATLLDTDVSSAKKNAEENPYDTTFNLAGWHSALAKHPHNLQDGNASDVIATPAKHGLLILDQLIVPGLANDWSEWLAQMHRLESEWFLPLLAAIKAGGIDQLSLILTHSTGVSDFSITKNSLRKFWIKPTLARLRP